MRRNYEWGFRVTLLFTSLTFSKVLLGGGGLAIKPQEILQNQIKSFQWENRVLATTWPKNSPQARKQSSVFLEAQKELVERKLHFVVIKKPYKQPFENNKFYLIGLDGSIKATSEKAFSVDQLSKIIDSMPMRQLEMGK